MVCLKRVQYVCVHGMCVLCVRLCVVYMCVVSVFCGMLICRVYEYWVM